MSTPALGGGPENPAAVGVWEVMLIILSAYPGVCGGNEGDPKGVLPKALRPGDARGFP